MISNNIDPSILEFDMNYVLVDHEKHALCDSYMVEFVHDATENGVGEVLILARMSPIPFESDKSSFFNISKSGLEEVMI